MLSLGGLIRVMVIVQENICTLGTYVLKYLRIKRHDVKQFGKKQKKGQISHTHTQPANVVKREQFDE